MTSLILENDRVRLSPLRSKDLVHLMDIAREKDLVQYSPSTIHTEAALHAYIDSAIKLENSNLAIPFTVYDKKKSGFAGSTRFMNIDWKNKNLEIGSTWIGKEFQGTGLNHQMKHLMINHAFDVMKFERISFRIDERNIRSRKAVEKIGAILEGVIRRDTYLSDEYKRNTCIYGILANEWDN